MTSSIASKLWMAATGLFLCLFLVVHLFGKPTPADEFVGYFDQELPTP